jgi:signal transduction histidine kinase/CheY-like chemotaxis protein
MILSVETLQERASPGWPPPDVPRTRRVVVPLTALVALVAVVALLGWAGEWQSLVELGRGRSSMKVQTAVAVLALAGGLLVGVVTGREGPRRAGGAVAALVGAVALVEYAVGAGSALDQWPFDDPWTPLGDAPGRMSVPTAFSCLALGAAGVLLTVRARWAHRAGTWAVAVGLLPVAFALLGTAFDAPRLYGLFLGLSGVSLPTALTLVVLAGVLLLDRPLLVTAALVGHDPGSQVFRRVLLGSLVPVAVAVVAYGSLVDRAGWAPGTVLGLVCVVLVLVVSAIAWMTGAEVTREATALAVARDEAARSDRAKTEFLSRMSHELRTPMNAILGFGQLLEMQDGDDREEARHILRAGRHLLGLIDEVLDIARIEEGTMALSREPLNLRECVAAATDLAAPDWANTRGVRVEHAVAPGLWVEADRQRLTQVLVNLVSNAVKYNRPGGLVTVASRVVADEEGSEVHVIVTDEGPGLDDVQQARLFESFERLGAEASEVPGTGLGLVLSRGLARLMGGDLTAVSTPGEGSAFTVRLRAAVPPRERPTTPEPPRVELDRPPVARVVLQIEDNPANLTLVEHALPLLVPGTRVLSTAQGSLGAEMAVRHRPDLILLDLHLPDTTGEETLRMLRADPATADLPVVVVTADATRATRERLEGAGVAAFLTKPLELGRLRDILAEVPVRSRGGVRP